MLYNQFIAVWSFPGRAGIKLPSHDKKFALCSLMCRAHRQSAGICHHKVARMLFSMATTFAASARGMFSKLCCRFQGTLKNRRYVFLPSSSRCCYLIGCAGKSQQQTWSECKIFQLWAERMVANLSDARNQVGCCCVVGWHCSLHRKTMVIDHCVVNKVWSTFIWWLAVFSWVCACVWWLLV